MVRFSSGKWTKISFSEMDFIKPILPLKNFFSKDKSFFINIICAPTFNSKYSSIGYILSGKSSVISAL